MKVIYFFIPLVFLMGCAQSGYTPHYIISDTLEEASLPKEVPHSDATTSL